MNEQPATGSDEEVIADSIGDPSRFALLFDRHYDQVWRYVCRRADATVADELASEVFVRALAGRSALSQGEINVRAWLYGIATNLLREQSRSEARRWRAYARAVGPTATPGGLDEVEGRVDAAARGPAVARALAGLQTADRETLLLLALTELDYAGIAIATGAPIGTVRSRLHRARRQVRLELGLEPAFIDAQSTTKGDGP
jgi:RNA polymerase sigma-70 factor (ECF subfamily)